MDLLSALLRSGGFEALSRRAGLPVPTINDIAGVMVPEQFEAMRRFVRIHGGGGQGVDALMALLDTHGDGDLAAAMLSHDPMSPDPGRDLIRRFYPDPLAHDEAIGRMAFESGHGRETVARLAPYAMMLLGGYLSARSGAGALGPAGTRGLGPFFDALIAKDSAPE